MNERKQKKIIENKGGAVYAFYASNGLFRTGMKRRPWLIAAAAFALVAAALALIAAFAVFRPADGHWRNRVEIATYEDLAALAEARNFNNEYVLTADIEIPVGADLCIGSAEAPFTGSFDGRGHTLTYSVSYGSSPLFGYVAAGAQISRLCVAGQWQEAPEHFAAGIALSNAGTISDCYVRGFSLSFGGYAVAGGIAAYNTGSIERCVAEVNVTKTGSDFVMRSSVGAVAGQNGGTVAKCVAKYSYQGFAELTAEGLYEGGLTNGGIGAVCGRSSGGETEGCAALLQEGLILSDAPAQEGEISFRAAADLYDADYLFDTLGFSHNVWVCGADGALSLYTEVE